jgi:ankyrin repeat protein
MRSGRDHLEELLKHNANVNMQNEMGFTPMHDAITGDGKPGGKEVVERLIKSGASLTI